RSVAMLRLRRVFGHRRSSPSGRFPPAQLRPHPYSDREAARLRSESPSFDAKIFDDYGNLGRVGAAVARDVVRVLDPSARGDLVDDLQALAHRTERRVSGLDVELGGIVAVRDGELAAVLVGGVG